MMIPIWTSFISIALALALLLFTVAFLDIFSGTFILLRAFPHFTVSVLGLVFVKFCISCHWHASQNHAQVLLGVCPNIFAADATLVCLGCSRTDFFLGLLGFFLFILLFITIITCVETGQQLVKIRHSFVKVFVANQVSLNPYAFVFRSPCSLDKRFLAVFVLSKSLTFTPPLVGTHVGIL